jgi:endonuclease-3
LKKIIRQINSLLIKRFGTPQRAKVLPAPLDMLIATILSQNTNDQNSYKAFRNLKRRFKSWNQVLAARRVSIEKEIKVAGLGLQKSTAIKNLLSELHSSLGKLDLAQLKELNEQDSIDYLTQFKGVGVKTASCVLLFSLDKNICPVDTHVHRTLNRIGVVETKTPDRTFLEINADFPQNIAHSFHTNLIRLGREICKPSKYHCANCPVEKLCEFEDKNLSNLDNSSPKSFMLLDNI